MFSVVKVKRQLQMFSVAKAKRQLQMFSARKRSVSSNYAKAKLIRVDWSVGWTTSITDEILEWSW
ncbi:hypothetical protein [Lysinibacillus xylanilyticus]|uniref:hypothetical protein n=1 Tax=Lysinibacillus xylanilyticus TaxID=582475 RepID=UPI003815C967